MGGGRVERLVVAVRHRARWSIDLNKKNAKTPSITRPTANAIKLAKR